MTEPRVMTRREFVHQIAFEYAEFAAQYPGQKIQPLDRQFARATGRLYVESGRYRAQTDRAKIDPMWMDWDRVATEARKQLPAVERLVREYGDSA